MTMDTKQEVLREHLPKYLKASRKEKGQILDSLTMSLQLDRKSIIRALSRERKRDPANIKKLGRKIIYHKGVTAALEEVWHIAGYSCAERLIEILPEYIRILQRDAMWSWGTETTSLLLQMSLGTMKDRLTGLRKARHPRGYSTTKTSELKELIPVRTGAWDNPRPGYGEIDTVVHCGATLLGNMAYSVNFTDITTAWTETAAQLNKGQEGTLRSIEIIEDRLPFPMLGLDPDSGSEFINWHLKAWCDKKKIELSRSRPNHRNDNAHIEQKNYTAVRKVLGYGRIDKLAAIKLMNQLYAGSWRLYFNYFQPTAKCIKKIRIGSRYVRLYDKARTPYQRVLAQSTISQDIKDTLTQEYDRLNPAILRKEIDVLVEKIFKIQRLR